MRTTAAVAFLAGLCAATGWLSGCHKREGRAPEIAGPNVRIELGTSGVIDPEGWSTLTVLLRNQGETFRGEVEIVGLLPGDGAALVPDPVRYRMELEVPGGLGAFRQVTIPVRTEDWSEFEVGLHQPGYGEVFRRSIPPGSPNTFRILVIEDAPHELAAWTASLRSDLDQASGSTGRSVTPEINRLKPQELPATADGYSPFQIVLLYGATLEGVRDETLGALETWLRAGGTVLAIPGASWSSNLPARLHGILGIDHASPEDGVTPVASVQVSPGRSSYHFKPGLGHVTAFTRPLGDRETGIPSPAQSPADVDTALTAALARSYSFAGSSTAGLRSMERCMQGVLGHLVGFQVPEAGLIFVCLFLYALLGCVVPYLIFKRLKKTEWAYAFMLGAAILAIGAIWGLGALTSLHETQAHEVTIVQLSLDGTEGRATSFLGLASPGFREVDISAAFDRRGDEQKAAPTFSRVRVQPCRGAGPMGSMAIYGPGEKTGVSRMTLRVGKDGTLRVEPFTLYPNSLESVRIDAEVSLQGALRVERPAADEGEQEAKIVNRSDQSMSVSLLEGKRFADWINLAPGNAKSLGELSKSGQDWVNKDAAMSPSPFLWGGDYPGLENAQSSLFAALRRVLWDPRHTLNQWNPQVIPPAIPAAWVEAAPRYLIATLSKPFLPSLPGFSAHKGLTCYVIELPPEGNP